MKKYIPIVIVIIIILIGATAIIKFSKRNEKLETKNEISINTENTQDNNNNDIEDVKQSIGFSGQSDIYEIHKEDENTKILEVKPNVKIMVAYSGIIKKDKFSLEEAKKTFEENYNNHSGIYIVENSRNKFLNMLNSKMFNNKYLIDENGYLYVNEYNKKQTTNDELLVKYINSSFEYTVDISNTCYIVDDVSGEIMDYNFEEMDQYQICEYFSDDNRMILFITENSNNLISNEEIIENILDVMNI